MAWTEVAAYYSEKSTEKISPELTLENTAQQSLHAESEIASNEEIGGSGRLIPLIAEKAKIHGIDPTLAYDIMWCESRLQPTARNVNTNGTIDYSYWQINNYYHEDEAARLGLDMWEPLDNLEYGFILLSEGGTKFWSASQFCWENLQVNRT